MEDEIRNIEGYLKEIQEEIEPWWHEIDSKMENHGHKGFSKSFSDKGFVEKSQISATFAWILQTLYFTLLKLNNKHSDEHGVNEEIRRVQKLFIKLDKVIDPEKYKKKEEEKKTNEVPKRIISHAISANNFIKKKQNKEKERAQQKAKNMNKQ